MWTWFEGVLQAARKRALDRIAAAYAVGGWLLVQAASIALPAFDAPPWLLRWLIAALVVGFPTVLISVWLLKKPEEESWKLRHFTGRNAVFVSLVALVAVLTLGELAWHWSASDVQPGTVQAISAAPNSIAVLPFDNMSGDPKQKYFSEGISSELIGLLARNPALRVAARTSSFFFEGKEQDIRVIARKLNVRAILEGSVQSDGSHLHIEASLVNAANGYQLWSQSYDRSLSDILSVQAQIAQAIAQALAPTLAGTKPSAQLPKPTQIDPQVYRDYLQAQVYFDQRLSEGQTPASQAALNQAADLFSKVAAAAPDFADGQAALALALLTIEQGTEFDRQIDQATRKALAIDPQNPQALLVAIEQASGRWDWDGVIKNAVILKRTAAHTAIGAEGLGEALESFALRDEATDHIRDLVRIDPFSYSAWSSLTNAYFAEARYEDVIATAAQALALHPDDPVTREYQCVSFASLGRIAEARGLLDALSKPGIPLLLQTHCKFFVTLHSAGQKAAVAYVDAVLAHNPSDAGPPGDVGFMLSHTGAIDQAMDWYEKAFNARIWAFGFYPGKTATQAFLASPRWIALTQRPEYQSWLAARERARRELVGDSPS